MNHEHLQIMHSGKGFIAALDQSGGSTPKALKLYGVDASQYADEDGMFDLIHQMRTRIIECPAFSKKHILGAILFENTLHKTIEGLPSSRYLLEKKHILSFLKVDKGLKDQRHGVQLMKDIPELKHLLKEAAEQQVFGTKMRSLIHDADQKGIELIVEQQFDLAKQILEHDLIPIVEPEINIESHDQKDSEKILLEQVKKHLAHMPTNKQVIFKFSLPTQANFYQELLHNPHVLRIVALSGGYSRNEANKKLAQNNGIIASFSRALTEGLKAQQSDKEFNDILTESILSIYEASIT